MADLSEKEKIVNMGLIHIVDNDRDIKTIFNKKAYENEFLKFYQIYSQSLTAYDDIYRSKDVPEDYAREVAGRIMNHEMEKIKKIDKKSAREMQMMEDSAFAALFVIPAIDKYGNPGTDLLADSLIEEWHKNFPRNQIKKGHFEEINNGFKKRSFCYITTAVCGSMAKPDDCYELRLLRNYRDGWLSRQEDGEKLINSYYNRAPAIVALIDSRKDRVEIYQQIYEKYLIPCLNYIEKGEFAACRNTYIKMIERLEYTISTGLL